MVCNSRGIVPGDTDGPEFFEITFADSPYTVTRTVSRKQIIDVDCTDGVVILVLYGLKLLDLIEIKKTDISANKLTYQGNGFNIDDLSERDISGQYNSDRLIGKTSQWGRY